jgi:maleate isomerase
MLTPSSNTVVEPMTTAMLSGVPNVTAHFSRFKVTEIAIAESSDQQFAEDEILKAANLLTHARVNVIAWNGTSASWLGFERDEQLCERICSATGVAACTSVLAFREIFQRTGVARVGLVTPYVSEVQARILDNWRDSGVLCTAERHCGLRDNFAFAEVSEHDIAEMAREVGRAGVDVVAIVCTNMRGAGLVEKLEAELGVPVYDSIATTLWKSLLLADVAPVQIRGWGSLFSNPLLMSSRAEEKDSSAASG